MGIRAGEEVRSRVSAGMISCGNCGRAVAESDVTCPHCDALLAAWKPARKAGESVEDVTPDYARPPVGTPPPAVVTPAVDKDAAARVVNTIYAIERSTASRLVNTIQAYVRIREGECEPARSTASQRRDISRNEALHGAPTGNMAFVIGTVLVVALILMWGIVTAMVYTDTLSIEFIGITIVLTLAFKPTINSLRSLYKK